MPDLWSIFTPWSIALVLAVSAQATVLAYLHRPAAKAFLLALPVPSTLAMLALGEAGKAVDATNVLGLALLLLYTHGVRLLHQRSVPIIPAIAASALFYCAGGWAMAQVVPPGDAAFWLSCALVVAVGVVALALFPHRPEPGHRTVLPVWIKLPIIMSVIVGLLAIKTALRGFMTMFPMVGVVAAYEMRKSLWISCRQMAVFAVAMVVMLAEVRLTQGHIGLPLALAAGWVIYLAVLLPLNRWAFAAGGEA